jgi:hypothetical protein
VKEEEPDSAVVRGAPFGAPAAAEVKSEDISAVAATVATRAAVLSVSLTAKAYEKLVAPAFPIIRRNDEFAHRFGIHMCVCVRVDSLTNSRLLGYPSVLSKTFDELSASDWNPKGATSANDSIDRWRKLDLCTG